MRTRRTRKTHKKSHRIYRRKSHRKYHRKHKHKPIRRTYRRHPRSFKKINTRNIHDTFSLENQYYSKNIPEEFRVYDTVSGKMYDMRFYQSH